MAIKPKPAPRAYALRFDLGEGRLVTFPPVGLDLAMAVLRLDPEEAQAEPFAAYVERLHAQATLLFGVEREHLLKELAPFQVAEIVSALLFAAAGMDESMFALWRLSQPQNLARQSALEMLGRLESLSIELAAELSKMPDEIGARPLADCVALQEQLYKARKEESEFQAAIHGAGRQ